MPTPLSRRPRRIFAFILPAVAAALLVAGCGGSGGKLHPVQGKVTTEDGPLTKGSVRFVPDTARGNTATQEPTGEIGGDGLYVLTTAGQKGAPAGWYKVTVVSTDPIDSTKPMAAKSYVAKKHNDAKTSGLTVEVVASPAAGAYDLKASAK